MYKININVKSYWFVVVFVLYLILQCNIDKIKCEEYNDNNNNDDDNDDDDEQPHQLIIFAVDGLLGRRSTPRFMPFVFNMVNRAGGVYTSKARTVQTSVSKPGWISLFYGATPSEYGCKDNFKCSVPSDTENFKSILDILEYDYNYSVEIHAEHHIISDAFNHKKSVMMHGSWNKNMMEYGMIENNLPQTNRRTLLFHFNGADHLGHSRGYGSHDYDAQVMCIDWQIYKLTMKLWEWEPERTTFLLISDHGGLHYEHNTFDLEALQVPVAMWGYNVAKHINLFSYPIDTVQVAPTLLYILDYDIPEYWKHKPVEKCKAHIKGISINDAKQSLINSTHPVEELTICPVPHDASHRGYKYSSVVVILSFIFGFIILHLLTTHITTITKKI